MLAHHRDLDVVIGVDTHTAAAVGAAGAVLEHLTVPADPAVSFGAGLTTALLAHCDAARESRQALAGVGLSEPRRRGDREALRVLLSTRAQAVTFRTRAISALHALVTSAPEGLRERLRTLPG